jgi:hypothetical protein
MRKRKLLSLLVLLAAVATGAWAQETYKVSVKSGTEDAGNWSATPSPAAEGATVTATYNGNKKVGSIKVVKKVKVATDLSTINANYTAQNGETLTGTLGANVKISIADGATVTLNNVTINGVNDSDYEWAGITCLGDATIILSGTNTVKGFYEDYPGIQAAAGKTLIINGTGSLTASSYDYAAAIGGGKGVACGNIEIQGGTITATSGGRYAGIGGGYNASCGNITISGGTVSATGGEYGAGIGGGYNASWGNITISGGNVTATGGNHGAGIGGGKRGTASFSCGNIIISGGTVNATGGDDAPGIGGGRGNNNSYKSSCGTITITTGVTKVTATMGDGATNSIGAGKYGTCGTVTIGGNVGAITTSPYTYTPSAPTARTAAEATAEDIGKLIGADGNIYDDAAAATAASTTAVAMIAYVGNDAETSTTYNHGLALALGDVSDTKNWCSQTEATCLGTGHQFDSEAGAKGDMAGIDNTDYLIDHAPAGHAHDAASAARGYNSGTHPAGTSAWFLPSAGQWDKMAAAAGSYASLIANAGLQGGWDAAYWSSTEGGADFAWFFDSSQGKLDGYSKDEEFRVRACLAF